MMLTAKHKTFSLALFMMLVVLLSLGLMLSVAQQADAGGLWSAWLFNPGGPEGTPRLLRVYEDGSTQEWRPPLAEGEFLPGPIMAFNDSGEWAAYCVSDDAGALRLEVHNLHPESRLSEGYGITFPVVIALGNAAACQVDTAAFNQANPGLLAFTVVHHWPERPGANAGIPAWELHVLDLAQIALTRTLTSDTPALAEQLPPDLTYLPTVRQYNGNRVVVALEPFQVGGWVEATAFAWEADSITPVEGFGTPHYTAVPGNPQRVWAAADEAQLAARQAPPEVPLSTLIYQDEQGSIYPIYAQPQGVLLPAFVNHGQQLTFVVPGFGVVALNRDGTTTGLPVDPNAAPLLHMPGGYAFVERDPATALTRFVLHRFTPDQRAINATVVWEDPEPGWISVWSAPVGALPELPPFAALGG